MPIHVLIKHALYGATLGANLYVLVLNLEAQIKRVHE